MRKLTFQILSIYIFLVIVFVVGITITQVIPKSLIKDNIIESYQTIKSEGLYPTSFANKYGWNTFLMRDQYTDCLMLNLAVSGNPDTPFESAVLNPCYKGDYNLETMPDNLIGLSTGSLAPDTNYDWYWHGYLVALKPLLVFFTYDQIRWINCLLMLIAVSWALFEVKKRLGFGFLLLSIGLLLAMHFEFLPYTMQYFSVFFVSFLSVAIMLHWKDFFVQGPRALLAFFIIGAVTVFVDFLTTPIVSLGIPLLYYLLCMEDTKDSKKNKQVVLLSLAWGIGYASLWMSKWALCALTFDNTVIINAFGHADKWAGNTSDIGRFAMTIGVVKKYIMLAWSFNWYWLLATGLFLLVFLPVKKECMKLHGWMLLIASMPFVWSLVLINHNYAHFGFTWRLISIFILSLSFFVYKCIDWRGYVSNKRIHYCPVKED